MFLFSHAIAIMNEGILTQKQLVEFPANVLIIKVLKLCFKLNYIANFSIKIDTKKNQLRAIVFFKPQSFSRNVLRGIKLISTPSSAIFIKHSNLLKLSKNSTFVTAFVSTDKGIFTIQEAVSLGLGGKLLCTLI